MRSERVGPWKLRILLGNMSLTKKQFRNTNYESEKIVGEIDETKDKGGDTELRQRMASVLYHHE